MNSANAHNDSLLATVNVNTDDAVGMSNRLWYVAVVNNRSEKRVAEKLTKMGVENYLPSQQEIHIWKSGKKVKIDKILIPAKIFVHCTERERKELVTLPFIKRQSYQYCTNINLIQ